VWSNWLTEVLCKQNLDFSCSPAPQQLECCWLQLTVCAGDLDLDTQLSLWPFKSWWFWRRPGLHLVSTLAHWHWSIHHTFRKCLRAERGRRLTPQVQWGPAFLKADITFHYREGEFLVSGENRIKDILAVMYKSEQPKAAEHWSQNDLAPRLSWEGIPHKLPWQQHRFNVLLKKISQKHGRKIREFDMDLMSQWAQYFISYYVLSFTFSLKKIAQQRRHRIYK
jgi:hypothetical protein